MKNYINFTSDEKQLINESLNSFEKYLKEEIKNFDDEQDYGYLVDLDTTINCKKANLDRLSYNELDIVMQSIEIFKSTLWSIRNEDQTKLLVSKYNDLDNKIKTHLYSN